MNSDSGSEIGIGMGGLVIREPKPSRELVSGPCEVALAQVDYRGTLANALWFALFLNANFPRVEVRSYCLAEPETPASEAAGVPD